MNNEEFVNRKVSPAEGAGRVFMAPFEIMGAILVMAFILMIIGLVLGIILLAMALFIAFSPLIAIGACIRGWVVD